MFKKVQQHYRVFINYCKHHTYVLCAMTLLLIALIVVLILRPSSCSSNQTRDYFIVRFRNIPFPGEVPAHRGTTIGEVLAWLTPLKPTSIIENKPSGHITHSLNEVVRSDMTLTLAWK